MLRIFLQTALMADDCVPKVTPGENEPSPSLALLLGSFAQRDRLKGLSRSLGVFAALVLIRHSPAIHARMDDARETNK